MTKTRKKVLTIAGIAVAVLIIAGVITFLSLRAVGKGSLEQVVAGEIPEMITTEMTEDEAAEGLEDNQIVYRDQIYEFNEDILTFLFMGIDHDGEVEEAENGLDGGQSDAMFLLVMNPHEKSISVVTINRNAMSTVDVYDADGVYLGRYIKQITLQHGYGDGKELSCERSVAAVSRLFYNLPINGYAAINMDAIPILNDAVGGVDVTVLEDIVYPEYDMNLHQGEEVTLSGMQAYWYVRLRDENAFDSNTNRQERQKQYLTTFAAKAKQQALGDIRVAINLYRTISEYMVTDIDLTKFTYLATEVLGYSFDAEHLYTLQGETVMGEKFEEFYVDYDALYQLIVDLFYEPVEE
jgi:LCP family protein required for cell wall assembly